jgi:hypothetical protein
MRAKARHVTDQQLQEIAERLIGQCMMDIDDAAAEIGAPTFDNWTTADAFAFDELAFRCSKCEWWVSGDDHAEIEPDDFICSECGND